ncbi:alpha/beta fold hydrolase [uncultured Pseudokineococcus sp.]|uniref:alpha/beta fold hydrolase n=1 Tax=uncultured Pseudokineococcus sp. TaxID=1642928 RepID=UPI00262C1556|nr:alpha/beta hydrolase [uncultured Pseudokineococcus sp.]
MTAEPRTSSFASPSDGLAVATYRWEPADGPVRGVVQVAHGLAEHGRRYARLAGALADAGFVVVACDHRGHGASTSEQVPLGSFGAAGAAGFVGDVVRLGELLRDEHPDLPRFLLGHSLGSMAAQNALLDHDDLWAGVVLSGSTAIDGLVEVVSALPPDAGLEGFNAPFPSRTGFEWLSRDEAEVDAYVADPLCGFAAEDAVLGGVLATAGRTSDPEALAGVRDDLPVLVVSGDEDPVGGPGGALVRRLAERYRDAGLRDVTLELRHGARHEVLNETDRDATTALVVDWLQQRAAAQG